MTRPRNQIACARDGSARDGSGSRAQGTDPAVQAVGSIHRNRSIMPVADYWHQQGQSPLYHLVILPAFKLKQGRCVIVKAVGRHPQVDWP